MDEDAQDIFLEVCRVIGREVIMLKENNQAITSHSLLLRLRALPAQTQHGDPHTAAVCAIATELIGGRKSVSYGRNKNIRKK